MDSISFDVDTALKEEKTASAAGGILEKTVIGAVTGGLVEAVVAIFNRKKKNKSNNISAVD